MAIRISRDHLFFSFHRDLAPAAHVAQGEEVVLETHDCFQGQLKSEQDLIDALEKTQLNMDSVAA